MIKLSEGLSSIYIIEEVINHWNEKFIFHYQFVKILKVETHARSTFSFRTMMFGQGYGLVLRRIICFQCFLNDPFNV